MRTPVESFVVRIYRCQGNKGQHLVGVVQTPRMAGSRAFTSVVQLWEILAERTLPMRTRRPSSRREFDATRGAERQFDPTQESGD